MNHRDPNIIEASEGFERGEGTAVEIPDEGQFFQCYAIIEQMTMSSVREQLWKLGWPYERIAVRVLGWEEAVTRLKDDAQSMCCMTRMLVAVEGMEGQLYLVRSPDLVTGIKNVHKTMSEASIQTAVNSAFKLN